MWHGYVRLKFSGSFGGESVDEGDKKKVEAGLDDLVSEAAKSKAAPQYMLVPRWNLKGDEAIVEAQFKSVPDKTAIVEALLPAVGIPLDAMMDFEIFGGGEKDWEASRVACLAHIVSEAEKWNIPVNGK